MGFSLFRIVALFALLMPALAWAEKGGQALKSDDLLKIFRETVTAQSPWPAENLEIEKFRIRPDNIRLPYGELGYRIAGGVPNKHPGLKTLDLIVSIDGKDRQRVKMSGELHLFGDVVCTVNKMGRGEVVGKEDIRMVRSDLSWQPEGVVFDLEQVVGKRLKSSLRAGSVLVERYLEEMPLVQRGDTVKIQAGSPPLLVTAPGRVKNAGAVGDLVRVKNLMSRKILLARVRDDKTVVVEY